MSSLGFILAFKTFGIDIPISSALLLASLANLSLLIAITPANLGVAEAVTIFTALAVGISVPQSLAVSLLNRAVQMLVLFVLGPIFSYNLLKKANHNKQFNK